MERNFVVNEVKLFSVANDSSSLYDDLDKLAFLQGNKHTTAMESRIYATIESKRE